MWRVKNIMAAIRKYKNLSTASPVREYKCYLCQPHSNHVSRAALHAHKSRLHRETFGGALQPHPWEEDEDPFQEFPVLDEIREVYFENEVYILTPHVTEDVIMKQFNFPIKGHVTNVNVQMQMRYIYNHPAVTNAYRVQLGAGIILYNRQENYYRYFRASTNMYILDSPLKIWNWASLNSAIEFLIDMDLDTFIRNFRPDSSYNVVFITNLEYYVFLSDFPLRGCGYNLPHYIESCGPVNTSFKVKGYERCCVFVALAQHLNPRSDPRRVVREVKQLFRQWVEYCKCNKLPTVEDIKKFEGIPFSRMTRVEDCFKVKITIFSLKPNKSVITEYTSQAPYENQVYMNLYKDHLNLIKAQYLDSYTKTFACKYCGTLHRRRWNCILHEKSCMKMSRQVFPSGYYRYDQTLFERLDKVGIHVPSHLRCKRHFAVFDLEAMLERIEEPGDGKLKFTHKHKVVSAAYGSSVEGYRETLCTIDSDPEKIVSDMFEYFAEVRQAAVTIEMTYYEEYLDELEYKLNAEKLRSLNAYTNSSPSSLSTKERKLLFKSSPLIRQYAHLLRDFYTYISQLCIFGYNSAKVSSYPHLSLFLAILLIIF